MPDTEVKAGRALDAEIAEKVFGWRRLTLDEAVTRSAGHWRAASMAELAGRTSFEGLASFTSHEHWYEFYGNYSGEFLFVHDEDDLWAQPALEYSTDIAAAWGIVERIKALGSMGFQIHYSPTHHGQPEEWTAGVMSPGDHGEPEMYGHESGSGETAPLAICLAALQTVEIR